MSIVTHSPTVHIFVSFFSCLAQNKTNDSGFTVDSSRILKYCGATRVFLSCILNGSFPSLSTISILLSSVDLDSLRAVTHPVNPKSRNSLAIWHS